MMIYELAVVEDHGSYWDVINVTKNSLDNALESTQKHLKLSYGAYELIREALLNNQEVRIPKSVKTDEIMPSEVFIGSPEEPDMESHKKSTIARIRMQVTPELSGLSGLTLYGFMCLNNELNSKGYHIYDDNREEVYLEILETGDSVLIDKLESYLNYKDEIHRIFYLERGFTKIISEIRDISNVNEESITKMADEYLDVFFKRNGSEKKIA